jgi:xanthine dehydrogenase small subunit
VRGAFKTIELLRPKTPEEALKAFAARPKAVPLAGGTDFMVSFNLGLLNGKTVLDLSRLADWTRIRKSREGLHVGALVTHAQLQADSWVRREFPLLVEACATVGAAQIQNRGTIGGNIANASPAGDSFPALSVYEAKVHVASAAETRVVPFGEIFAGVKKTTLLPGELITGVELPFLKAKPTRASFRKIGTRAAQSISKTVAAGLLWISGGKVKELRFALGSMAPTVRRLKAAEAFLAGKALDASVVEQACLFMTENVSPIDDVRSTREYRLFASQNLLRRFLAP